MYSESIENVFKHGLEDKFKNKCMTLLSSTEDMGWGFNDYLSDLYYAYYEEDYDDIESNDEAREE